MSFLRKLRKAKRNHKNIKNFTIAKAYINVSNPIFSEFFLELDGSFKMVNIEYFGWIEHILDSDYSGMSIKNSNGKIIVTNHLNSQLNENVLFRFMGVITKINRATVYRWGQQSDNATIDGQNFGEFSKNDNVVSSDAISILGFSSEDFEERLTKEQVSQIKTESMHIDGIVKGFYTNGGNFREGSKIYVGYYHYHPKTKKYMTGSEYTPESKIITKIKRTTSLF